MAQRRHESLLAGHCDGRRKVTPDNQGIPSHETHFDTTFETGFVS